ncbi:MAG TPA: hypothetical protein VKU41_07840 [Polyangiaceae bacterium]|nr:hypothetical protein [Polyangiaceae bacterium]
MLRQAPVWIALPVFVACAHAPAPSSPASGSATEPEGAAEAQDTPTRRDELRGELDAVNAKLADLGRRLERARDDVKVELQGELAALQGRRDELKAQLKSAGEAASAEGDKMRDRIHRGILNLRGDINRLEDRIQRRDPP